MSNTRTCRRCGIEIPEDSALSSCGSCLLGLGLSGSSTLASGPAVANDSNPMGLTSSQPARVFGDYTLLAEIARGGMGVVYHARQHSLSRDVAVKFLLPGFGQDLERNRRFRLEAEAAASLEHPNIVAIHEVGEWDGQPFFSMDLVEGRNLSELASASPIPFHKSADYLIKISEAVHHAHQRGVLHRDLKPSNILLDSAGEPRVTDFGLAKFLDDDRDLTATGQMVGTPSFMAPELVDRSRGGTTTACDVYALGCVLYFVLTGRPPFHGPSLESTLLSVLNDAPTPVRQLRPDVPRDLEVICLHCLQKEPGRRYATALELAKDLRRFVAGEPIRARPVSFPERTWMWARRQPALAALALLLTATLVGGSIQVSLSWLRERQARGEAERLIEFMNADLVERLRPLGRLDLLNEVNAKAEAYYRNDANADSSEQFLLRKSRFLSNKAGVLLELGKLSEADASIDEAAKVLERVGLQPDVKATLLTRKASIHALKSRIQSTLLDHAPALEEAERGLAFASQALARSPDDDAAQAQLAEIHLLLASSWHERLRSDAMRTNCQRAEEIYSRRLTLHTNDTRSAVGLGLVKYWQGYAAADEKRKDEAQKYFQDYLQHFERLCAKAPGNADFQRERMMALSHVAWMHFNRRQYPESLAMYSNHNASAQALVDHDPSNVIWQRDLIESLEWMAAVCEKMRVHHSSISNYWQQAYAIAQKLNGINASNEEWSSTLRRVRLGVARDLAANGNREGAEVLWAGAMNQVWNELLSSPHLQRYHESLSSTIKARSAFLWEYSTPEARVAFHEQCLQTILPWEAASRTNAWWLWTLAGGYGQLSGAFNLAGRKVEALQNLQRALSYRERLHSAFPNDGKVIEYLVDNYHWVLNYALETKDWRAGEQVSRAAWQWTSTNRIAPLQLPYVHAEVGALIAEFAGGLPAEEAETAASARRLAERCFKEWFGSAPALNEEEKKTDQKLRELLGLPLPNS